MALTQISTAGVKDDAVTAGKIPANAVGSSELADNAVDTAAIAADAVTGAKIADDAINSEHYTDGSIDTAHIADSAVTDAKIASGISANKITGLTTDAITEGDSKVEVIDSGSNGNIQFVTDNTTRAQFKTGSSCDNQLLIGTAGSSNQDIDVGVCIGSSAFSRPGVIIRGDSTNKGDISFCDNSNSDSSDGVSEGLLRYDHATDHMEFHTADSERMRISSAGAVGINDNNPSDKLSVVGTTNFNGNSYIGGDLYMYGSSYTKGIFLGGSGSANKLDDYEEGSYTPVIYYDSTNNHTYSEQLGLYTKIGNFVYGTIAITWDDQASTGQVGISLPFTSANVAGTRTAGYLIYQDGLSVPSGQGSTHLIGYGGQNASSMYFYFTGGTNNSDLGPSGTQLTNSHTSTHTVMRILFHYRTG